MQHTHRRVGNIRLLRYVVLTNKNEYIIHGSDNIEAGYRAINLAGLLDEELKEIHEAIGEYLIQKKLIDKIESLHEKALADQGVK